MPLLNTKIKARLLPGKYPIHINSYKEFENEQGGYVQISVSLPDRDILQNFFPSNLNYLGKSLRTQMGLAEDEEHDLVDILDQAMNSDKLFAVISYNDYGMNLAFHEKVTVETAEDVKF